MGGEAWDPLTRVVAELEVCRRLLAEAAAAGRGDVLRATIEVCDPWIVEP